MTDRVEHGDPSKKSTRKLGTLTLLLMVAFVPAANAETRNIEAFNKVVYALPFAVEFVASDTHFVKLEGDEDTIDAITTEVSGDTLKISKENRWFDWFDGEIIVTVGYTRLDAITMTGSGNGFVAQLTGDQLNLKISGSAELELDELMCNDLTAQIAGSGGITINQLEADTMQTTIAGSGDVDVSGRVISQDITLTGSGDHNARQLRSQEANVKLRGSGDAELWALTNLHVEVMGSGDVGYYGDPRVSERIVGSGTVKHRGREP